MAFQTEGAVQAVLCSAPDVPERNFLQTSSSNMSNVHQHLGLLVQSLVFYLLRDGKYSYTA